MSLSGIRLHIARFFNENGDYVGSKIIKTSIKKGIKKKEFEYQEGTYHVKQDASKIDVTEFPYFFEKYIYIYTLGIPDPLKIKHGIEPMINSYDYNTLLKSKVLRELNGVRKKGLSSLLTTRNIIIIILILGAIIYFTMGGSLTGAAQ